METIESADPGVIPVTGPKKGFQPLMHEQNITCPDQKVGEPYPCPSGYMNCSPDCPNY